MSPIRESVRGFRAQDRILFWFSEDHVDTYLGIVIDSGSKLNKNVPINEHVCWLFNDNSWLNRHSINFLCDVNRELV